MSQSIFELLIQIPPIADTALRCFINNRVINTLKDVNHDIQLYYLWLTAAKEEIEAESQEGVRLSTSEPPKPLEYTIPNDTQDQLTYMYQSLKALSKDTEHFIELSTISPSAQYKVLQAYNKVMEAMFNTLISTTYYEELSKHRLS